MFFSFFTIVQLQVPSRESNRPKYPFHYAVTMALLNAKKPLSLPEIHKFITLSYPLLVLCLFIAGDIFLVGIQDLLMFAILTITIRSVKYTSEERCIFFCLLHILCQIHWQYYLDSEVETFEAKIRKIMTPFRNRDSKDYGLANPGYFKVSNLYVFFSR